MAIIRSRRENDYVKSLASPGPPSWIGGIRLDSDGSSIFTWIDGTSLQNFSELNNPGGNGENNCLQLNANSTWSTANCVPTVRNNELKTEKYVCKRGNQLGTGI